MTPRRLPWPVLFALVTLASLAAHVSAHGLLAPAGGAPHAHHHGETTHWRACATVCGLVLAAALAAYLVESCRRGRAVHPPVWLAALLPPVAFAVSGGLGTRQLVLGLLLQLPVAGVFLLVARVLPRRAAALGRALRSASRPRLAALAPAWRPALLVPVPARAPAGRGALERGPPPFHRA
jgi:hypothetical protein